MQLSKEALLSKNPMFVDLFSDAQCVFGSFRVVNEDTSKYQILFAEYSYEDYSGRAYVLGYDKEADQFFENHGSHCSCYGLEGQWSPEVCSLEELQAMLNRRHKSDTFVAWINN